MQTPLVALHSRKQRAVEIAREALGSECNDTHVLVDPDVVDLENRFRDLAGRGELDLILGTGKVRDAARTLAVPFLELGYPSHVRHALFEAPSLGFRGSAWLVDMMANLLREHDYMRG
jgi:nitrogenase molybdenum-iron protein beta chain